MLHGCGRSAAPCSHPGTGRIAILGRSQRSPYALQPLKVGLFSQRQQGHQAGSATPLSDMCDIWVGSLNPPTEAKSGLQAQTWWEPRRNSSMTYFCQSLPAGVAESAGRRESAVTGPGAVADYSVEPGASRSPRGPQHQLCSNAWQRLPQADLLVSTGRA